MRIHHWIDKYNYKISYELLKKYNLGLSSGRPVFYYLHISFWGMYIFRLLLVITSLISFRKNTYKGFYNLVTAKSSSFYPADQHFYFFIKIYDILATLFGFRYFSNGNMLPLLSSNEILAAKIHLTKYKTPVVSIIISLNNQLEYLYNCLLSLQKNVSADCSFEVIVIDYHSTDKIHSFIKKNTSGLIYLRSDEDQSLLETIRLSLKHSRGELICFLNDDVQVCKNWLESLITTLKQKGIGCVGSKIINKNGLLMHAGGIVQQDCAIIDYGKYEQPQHPFYNYVREADYCSNLSLIFQKSDLCQLDISRERHFSDPYENIDICFTIRHLLKKKVVYQPLSQLIHVGQIIDTKHKKDHERQQDLDKNNFAEKWRDVLSLIRYTGNINSDSRKYQTGKTMLFVDDVVPAPDQDSGSNRLFKIMQIVKSLGYHVIFVPNDGKKRGRYLDQMILEGFEVLYRFPNRKGMIKILLNILTYIDAAWLCKPHNNQLFKFIFETKKECLWIYDTIDLHFLRMQREAILTQDNSIMQSAKEIKEIELYLAKHADVTIAITNDEKVLLNEESIDKVIVIPNIHENKTQPGLMLPFENREGILFIGGYLHKPNIDAAEWLVKQIMPKVWSIDPSIKLTLLGSNPTEEILAFQSDKISVPGYIHDVSTYFNHNRVFIAPLRFGAGMKGKIGQSLEYGLPVVTTKIGIEGMGLTDGLNVLIGENADDLAAKILQLYGSTELWNKIRANSIVTLEQYTPKKVTQKLKVLFESLSKLN